MNPVVKSLGLVGFPASFPRDRADILVDDAQEAVRVDPALAAFTGPMLVKMAMYCEPPPPSKNLASTSTKTPTNRLQRLGKRRRRRVPQIRRLWPRVDVDLLVDQLVPRRVALWLPRFCAPGDVDGIADLQGDEGGEEVVRFLPCLRGSSGIEIGRAMLGCDVDSYLVRSTNAV